MPPEERTFSSRDLWLLVLAAALLLLPNMIAREVRKGEALYSSVASDMVRTRALWVTTAHGAQQPFYPGYPWLVALGQELDLPPEIALRLPAVLCIATLAGLCGMVGYRRGGPVAGAVAAAVVICNPATLRCGTRAQSEPLLALLLCAAWMTWYSVGQRRKHWALAWAGAMLFVIPAAFTAGARAVAFFYLPFVFLRRPVKGRRRLLLPAHLVVLAATVAVIVFWLRRVPDQIFLPWNELNTMPKVTLSYPVEMILFPLKSLLYLMPWPFLFWPAFCMAYRPLESSPVVFHYLRTIVVSAFVAAWLIPKLSPLVLMPALGPIAIMTGLHAELLIRRHHLHLRRLNLAMLAVGIALAACGTAVAALHLTGIVRFDGIEPSLLGWNAVLLFAMLVAAVLALRGPLRSLPVHAHLVVAFTVLASSILALQAVWYSWAGSEQRAAGLALAGKIPTPDFLVVKPAAAAEGSTAPVAGTAPATTSTPSPAPASAAATPPAAPLTYRPLAESIVYQQTGNYYLSACFYLGRPVVRVEDPKTQIPLPIPGPRQVLGDVAPEAPPSPAPGATSADATYRDAVYALCDSGAPVLPAVEWTALTPPIDLRRRKIVRAQWFPGGTTLLRLYTEAAPLPEKPKPAAEKSTLDTENPIPDGEKSPLDAEKPKPEEYQPETVRLYRGVRR